MLSQMGDLYHVCYPHCLTFTLLLRFFLLFIVKLFVCECMFVTKVSTKSAERLCLCELVLCCEQFFFHKIIVLLYTCALENVSLLKMKYVL